MKFAIITAENLASNQIMQGLLSAIGPHVSVVFLVPNVPVGNAAQRSRFRRLSNRAHWRFLVFKFVEIFVSSVLHWLRGTTIRQRCRGRGVRTERYKAANDPRIVETLNELDVDVLLSAGPAILPGAVIASPRIATLNCHCARLPHFKGPANYIWMCLAGVRDIYVAIQLMTRVVDEGPVLRERFMGRNEEWSVYELNWKLSRFAGEVYGAYCTDLIHTNSLTREALQPDPGYAPIENRGFPQHDDFRRLCEKGVKLIRLPDIWRFY